MPYLVLDEYSYKNLVLNLSDGNGFYDSFEVSDTAAIYFGNSYKVGDLVPLNVAGKVSDYEIIGNVDLKWFIGADMKADKTQGALNFISYTVSHESSKGFILLNPLMYETVKEYAHCPYPSIFIRDIETDTASYYAFNSLGEMRKVSDYFTTDKIRTIKIVISVALALTALILVAYILGMTKRIYIKHRELYRFVYMIRPQSKVYNAVISFPLIPSFFIGLLLGFVIGGIRFPYSQSIIGYVIRFLIGSAVFIVSSVAAKKCFYDTFVSVDNVTAKNHVGNNYPLISDMPVLDNICMALDNGRIERNSKSRLEGRSIAEKYGLFSVENMDVGLLSDKEHINCALAVAYALTGEEVIYEVENAYMRGSK